LSQSLPAAGSYYIGLYKTKPVCFIAVCHVPSAKRYYRISRLVVLPDYQGIGIGKKFLNFVAKHLAEEKGRPVYIITSNPQMKTLDKNGWKLCRVGHAKQMSNTITKENSYRKSTSARRLTMTFKYCPKA